ncbi:type VI secretion system protein ImpA [Pelomonas saccharophila]|uniref:Type VI secretion system protein ImpA n=1 Tax=Roseateles saccharophilus TaxID=304 RepID=A0ABU1YVU8_ROSSA|nr:type VI secretion system protein TssA [Roseateles saccharophilus]MDR7272995.1 type VI secretion system protein ImpA [Roseateles saccharophilus]
MDSNPFDAQPDTTPSLSSDPVLAPWLQPVSEDDPCGPDLEYDNDFLALTQAAAGKPETQFAPAEPPDWRAVRSGADDINGRSRDLRVANLLLRARLRLEGFAVLAPGLRLFEELLTRWWDELHPRLDDGDAFGRINVLGELNSLDATLGDVRASLVLNDRGIGQISVRDIEIAMGDLQARDDESVPSRGQIENMLADAVAGYPQLATQAPAALAALESLGACLAVRLNYGDLPDFSALRTMLDAVAAVSPRPVSIDASADDLAGMLNDLGIAQGGDAGDDAPAPARRGRSGGGGGGLGAIESRADAVRAIDLVCAYLEKHEPTNPAADLLRRAQRLIDRNFLQLVREFAPDAVNEVARMLGVDPDSLHS